LLPLADGLRVVERHAQEKDGRDHHEREDDGDVGLPISRETKHYAAEHMTFILIAVAAAEDASLDSRDRRRWSGLAADPSLVTAEIWL
jgi:hypothetical protein